MKRKTLLRIAAIFLFGVLAARGLVIFLAAPPESVRNVDDIERRLKAASASTESRLTLDVIGQVAYAGFAAPIWRISAQREEEARFRVLLTGSIHGDEPAGAEFLLQFVEGLAQGRGPRPGVAFEIIPLLNPWGWAHDTRRNRDGHDLNRDFASFKNQESRLVRDYVATRHYDLMIDIHEDRDATGFYLYQLANDETALCHRIIESERGGGFPIEPDSWRLILSQRDGVISAPYWSLRLAKTGRNLSMTNYFRMTKCPRVYLVETPLSLDMEQRVAMDANAIEVLLDSLAAK